METYALFLKLNKFICYLCRPRGKKNFTCYNLDKSICHQIKTTKGLRYDPNNK